jgi:hypothetical protein
MMMFCYCLGFIVRVVRLDTKFEVCGGTREAMAIRRTRFARQCSRAYGIRSASLFAIKSIPFTHPLSPQPVVIIAPVLIVIRLKRLLLATLVIATCYSDLKPGVRI